MSDEAARLRVHDAAVETVKRYVHAPDVFDFAVAHRVIEAVLDSLESSTVPSSPPAARIEMLGSSTIDNDGEYGWMKHPDGIERWDTRPAASRDEQWLVEIHRLDGSLLASVKLQPGLVISTDDAGMREEFPFVLTIRPVDDGALYVHNPARLSPETES